jgi:hypothetical protein
VLSSPTANDFRKSVLSSPTANDFRKNSRWEILAAANRGVDPRSGGYLTMRQIQQAVFRCRQRRLVPEHVLVAAGYNPTKRRK